MKKDNKRSFSIKRLKIGAYGIAVTAVVIALVVLINLLVSSLPTTITHIHTGIVDFYDVGEESLKILENVNEDVTMYHVVESGAEDPLISELLSRYEAVCSKIKVKLIDPVENPAFVKKYTDAAVSQNSVIVESSKRSKVIEYSTDIYSTVYASAEDEYYAMLGYSVESQTYFNGELQFTSAIDYVIKDELPKIYVLKGHGEAALDEVYAEYVANENVSCEDINLLTAENIPDDSQALLISLPASDISDDELEKITTFMNRGGDVILITDFRAYSADKMPNLTALAAKAGLKAEDGIVVENDANSYYMAQYILVPDIAKADITSGMSDTSVNTLFNGAQGIYPTDDTKATVTPILTTSEKAEIMNVDEKGELVKKEDFKTGEAISIASIAETAVTDGDLDGVSSFVWYSSASIVDSSMMNYVREGNINLFTSTLNYFCGGETSISILGKTWTIDALVLTDGQRTFWMSFLTIVIPVAILGAGFAVWFIRRKK